MTIRGVMNIARVLPFFAVAAIGASCTHVVADDTHYADTVRMDKPAGYWRFEETDAAAVVNRATDRTDATGGAYINVSPGKPSATANLGAAAVFSGDVGTGYLDAGQLESIELGGDLTIEWWQYVTGTDSIDRAILSWTAPDRNGQGRVTCELALRFSDEQKAKNNPRAEIVFGYRTNEQVYLPLRSQALVHPHKWYHVTVAYNAGQGTVQFYINGVASGEAARLEPDPAAVDPGGTGHIESSGVMVGRSALPGAYAYQGLLDEVAVYNHRLAAGRILAHFGAALDGVVTPRDTLVVGHRGNNRYAPENTLISVEQGMHAGADIIEIDLHRSSDGEVVLLHDNTLNRTTDGAGKVESMTAAELGALDAGAWKDARYIGEPVPTFEQVARLCKDRTVMMLDLKVPLSGDEIATVLSRVGISQDKVIVAPWKVEQAEQLSPWLPEAQMILLHGGLPASPDDEAFFQDFKERGFSGLSIYWGNITKPFVDAAHRHGLRVYAWTLNDAEDIYGAVLIGIDGVITDDPAAINSYLDLISP